MLKPGGASRAEASGVQCAVATADVAVESIEDVKSTNVKSRQFPKNSPYRVLWLECEVSSMDSCLSPWCLACDAVS